MRITFLGALTILGIVALIVLLIAVSKPSTDENKT